MESNTNIKCARVFQGLRRYSNFRGDEISYRDFGYDTEIRLIIQQRNTYKYNIHMYSNIWFNPELIPMSFTKKLLG